MGFWIHMTIAVLQIAAMVFVLYAFEKTGLNIMAFFVLWSACFAGWSLASAWKMRK